MKPDLMDATAAQLLAWRALMTVDTLGMPVVLEEIAPEREACPRCHEPLLLSEDRTTVCCSTSCWYQRTLDTPPTMHPDMIWTLFDTLRTGARVDEAARIAGMTVETALHLLEQTADLEEGN